MQTDEHAGAVSGLGDVEPAGGPVEGGPGDGGIPEPPRFFGRRAWYRRRLEALQKQAALDDLTGLRNQRSLWHALNRWTSSCSKASPLTLVMLDLDRFSEVNEHYGHTVGDAVLARAATVLQQAVSSPRLAFRYGSDEFVLLVADDEAEGSELAERVRVEIASAGSNLPAITVSCGVAELDSPVEPWVALDRVDAALREAKRAGRNQVAVAGGTARTASAYLVEDSEHETARRAALALAVATLQVRDRLTADHADDVLALCESLGRELGFAGSELDRLMAGAQLHDVGKVAVPSAILNKAGPLGDDERAVIREHTVIGERILRSVPEMAEVATIVRHSHEHWDGGGYPDGLKGEQIPLASRVVLCADAFHAIRSDRPYRAGRPARQALEELRACAGTQFDPAVVDALTRIAENVRRPDVGGMSLPRNKRLVLLLTAFAITGTALATVPGLRDRIRSIFGVATSQPGGGFSLQAGGGFSLKLDGSVSAQPGHALRFGPLGDRLSLASNAVAGRRASGEPSRTSGRTRPSSVRARDVRAGSSGLSRRTGRGAEGLLDVGRHRQPVSQAPAPGLPTSSEKSGSGADSRAGNPDAPDRLAAPSVYCRAEPTKTDGRGHSDFSICVRAQVRLRSGKASSPGQACKGADKKHVRGETGTAMSRCVTAGAMLLNDRRG